MPYVVIHFFRLRSEIRLGLTENKKLGAKNKFGFYESMIMIPIFKLGWQLDIGQVSFWIKRHVLS